MAKKDRLKKFGLISVLSLFSFLFISCDGDGSSDGSSPNETEEISQTPPPPPPTADTKEAALTTLIIGSDLQQRTEMQLNGTLAMRGSSTS